MSNRERMAQVSLNFLVSRVECPELNPVTESCKTTRGTQLSNPDPNASHFPRDKCFIRVPALSDIPNLKQSYQLLSIYYPHIARALGRILAGENGTPDLCAERRC